MKYTKWSYFSQQGRWGWVDRLHLGSKSSMEYKNTFYFGMFFLNSKFHEIRELGCYFYLQGRRGGGNELHLNSNLFHEGSRILLTSKCSS